MSTDEKRYVFIISNENDAKLTEILLNENHIEFNKEVK